LAYWQQVKGHHTNNIEPVEAELQCYVHSGDKEEFQHMMLSCFYMHRLVVGNGSNAMPFCISMTSKTLLGVVKKLAIWELPVVLCMGATFKLNKNEFPIVILGISDAVKSLHIMLVSMISHGTEQMYKVGSRALFPQYSLTSLLPLTT
jgi:hypothetical protein